MGKRGGLSECVLLTCAQPCEVPRGVTRTSAYGSGSEGGQSLPLVLVGMLRVCTKSSTSNFQDPDTYSLKLLAGRDPLLRPADLHPAPTPILCITDLCFLVVVCLFLLHQSSHPPPSPALLCVCLCVCPYSLPLPPSQVPRPSCAGPASGYRDAYTTC